MTFDQIQAARARLQGQAHVTPVMTSRLLDARCGAPVFLKCENFQRIGAVKFRGAFNALSQLSEEQKRRGVVAFSSGNHAQGVARAATQHGISSVIIMPADAPRMKVENTRALGAEVVERAEGIGRYRGEEAHSVLPPHRLALAHPVLRDAWYSGSPAYLRTIAQAGLARIEERYAVRGPVVVMGAYGHSRIRQLIVGRTTTTLLRLSEVPVQIHR